MTDSGQTDIEAPEPAAPVAIPPPARLTNFSLPARMGLIALVGLAAASFQLEWAEIVRAPLVLVFFTLLPGAALMACARKVDRVTLLAMSMALSLSLDVTIVLVALWARLYSPGGLMWVLATICVLLLMGRAVFERGLRYGQAVRAAQVAAASEDPADSSQVKRGAK